MITNQEAKQLAEIELNKRSISSDDSLIILDVHTIEKEYAWIFFYQSKKYEETKDIRFLVGGNGPLFISKTNGQIASFRTGLSIDEMIDQYEEENNYWHLTLNQKMLLNVNQFLAIRKLLHWSITQLSDFKKSTNNIVEIGSKRRLLAIQEQLALENIKTNIELILDKE